MLTESWVDFLGGSWGFAFAFAAGTLSFLSPCVLVFTRQMTIFTRYFDFFDSSRSEGLATHLPHRRSPGGVPRR